MDLSAIRPPPPDPGLSQVVTRRILHFIRRNAVNDRFPVACLTLHHCTLRDDEVPEGVPVNIAAIAPRLTTLCLHDMDADERLLAKMLEGSGAQLAFLSLRDVTLHMHSADGHARASLERCLGAAETYGRLETLVVAGVAVCDAELRQRHTPPLHLGFITRARMPRLSTLAVDVRATIPPGGHYGPAGIEPMPELRTLVIGRDVDAVWGRLPAWCPGLHSLISASEQDVKECSAAAIISPVFCAVAGVRAVADAQGLAVGLEEEGASGGAGHGHVRVHAPDTLLRDWAQLRPRPQQLYIRDNVMGGEKLQRALDLVDTSGVREVDLSGSGTVVDGDKTKARALLLALPQGLTKVSLDLQVGQYALEALATDDTLLDTLRVVGIGGKWPKPHENAMDIARLSMQRLHPRGELRCIEVYTVQGHGMSATEFEVRFRQAHEERGIPTPLVTMLRGKGGPSGGWCCTICAALKPDPDTAA